MKINVEDCGFIYKAKMFSDRINRIDMIYFSRVAAFALRKDQMKP